MGGNEADGYFTIQRALDIARNSEGVVDPTISSYLERALRDVWARLEAAPESYILTKDEFALFNFFRHRFTASSVAQGAVQRFWDNYQGDPREFQSATNGNTVRTTTKRVEQSSLTSVCEQDVFSQTRSVEKAVGVSTAAKFLCRLIRTWKLHTSDGAPFALSRQVNTTSPIMDVFQVSPPVNLPAGATSKCNKTLMVYSFGQSYGKPFVGQYEPPACEFDHVIMNFTVTSAGRQFDRLAIMYLSDAEIWRTSTAEPTNAGITWTYMKDSSNFLYLWKQPQKIIFDLGNNIDNTYTGPFNTTLTATFFSAPSKTKSADVILPLSAKRSAQGQSSAWNFPDTRALDTFTIPQNARKAIFSLSAVGQANEEFWWSNVPSSTTNTFVNNTLLGYSPFREVQLLIDGELAGVSWPFPVIFTGGVVPGFWRPLVGIDAFDMQEDEIDITPWLSVLSDGKPHSYEIKVMGLSDDGKGGAVLTEAPSSWIVSGKMFLWLDATDSITSGASMEKLATPPTFFLTAYTTKSFNGTNATLNYQVLAKRQLSIASTIYTADGPKRASWTQTMSFSNIGIFNGKGNKQTNDQITTGVEVSSSGYSRKLSYPLRAYSSADINPATQAMTLDGRLDREKNVQVIGESTFPTGLESYTKEGPFDGVILRTRQNGTATYKVVPAQNRSASWGGTEQDMVLSGLRTGKADYPQVPLVNDDTQLYSRNVLAVNGTVRRDGASTVGRNSADDQTAIMTDSPGTDVQGDFALVTAEDVVGGKLMSSLSRNSQQA